MSSPSDRLRALDFDTAYKATMVQLCRDLGLPHGGLKAQVETRLRAHAASLPPASSTPTASIAPAPTAPVTTAASSAPITVSNATEPTMITATGVPLPAVLAPAGEAPAGGALLPTAPLIPTAQQAYAYGAPPLGAAPHAYALGASFPGVPPPAPQAYAFGASLPGVPPPAPQAYALGASLPGVPPPAPRAYAIGAPLPGVPPPAPQAYALGASLPGVPPPAPRAYAIGAPLPGVPPPALQAYALGAPLPGVPPPAPQGYTFGASLPGVPPPPPQAHAPGALLPGVPPPASQAYTLGAPLYGIPPPTSQVPAPPPLAPLPGLQQIAQQAAQAAAQQAVAQATSQLASQSSHTPLPLQPTAQVLGQASSTSPSWVYQPPAAPAQTVTALQQALAARATAPGPSNLHFAPLSGTMPAIPAKFVSAAAAGEFIDFNELLHAIEVDSGEEPALQIQVAEGQHLSLPRKPRKKLISTFAEWVRCFSVYASTLCAYQPQRGPDMLAYLFIVASAQQEFTFPPCLAYDVAFRKKAARFRLATWGQLDPQLYAVAFTGPGKSRTNTRCTLCLEATHSTQACPLYTNGPAKKPRATPAGPKRTATRSHGKEICHNFNRGTCSREGCPRSHVCLVPGCGGPHPALHCTLRRSSPRTA